MLVIGVWSAQQQSLQKYKTSSLMFGLISLCKENQTQNAVLI